MGLTDPKIKHGGARKGAGRPSVDTVEHRVRLPRQIVGLLTALGNGRLSVGIVCAAKAFRAGEKKPPEG